MNKKLISVHILCFFGVVVVASSYLFYQVFLDGGHNKISLKNFIRPKTFSQAVAALTNHSVPSNSQAIFIKDSNKITKSDGTQVADATIDQQQIFLINENYFLVEVTTESVKLTNLSNKKTKEIALAGSQKTKVIGWFDQENFLLSQQSSSYSLVKANFAKSTLEPVIESITYPDAELMPTAMGKITTLAYPDCTPKCNFVIYDFEKNAVVKTVPAFTDPSHEASLSDAVLLFYDHQKGLLGYLAQSSKEVYVIDHELNLLQLIRLENDRNMARFVGYYPQTAQMLFSLEERDGSSQTVAVYAANKPSLHLLTTKRGIKKVLINSQALTFQLDQTIYDLNGHEVLPTVTGEMISVY